MWNYLWTSHAMFRVNTHETWPLYESWDRLQPAQHPQLEKRVKKIKYISIKKIKKNKAWMDAYNSVQMLWHFGLRSIPDINDLASNRDFIFPIV